MELRLSAQRQAGPHDASRERLVCDEIGAYCGGSCLLREHRPNSRLRIDRLPIWRAWVLVEGAITLKRESPGDYTDLPSAEIKQHSQGEVIQAAAQRLSSTYFIVY